MISVIRVSSSRCGQLEDSRTIYAASANHDLGVDLDQSRSPSAGKAFRHHISLATTVEKGSALRLVKRFGGQLFWRIDSHFGGSRFRTRCRPSQANHEFQRCHMQVQPEGVRHESVVA